MNQPKPQPLMQNMIQHKTDAQTYATPEAHGPATSHRRLPATLLLAAFTLSVFTLPAPAQSAAPAAAPAAANRQIGTIKAITGSSVTLTTDAGQQVAVTIPDGARILQLAPGSTDLKAAQAITLSDVATGDRVLVTGKPGDDPSTFTATRLILMKSGDIAQKHAAEQADWQKRGAGGIVSGVDPATGIISVTAGVRKTQVQTSPTTTFRRYSGDSVKFEDAKPGTLPQIQPGDQLRVRGTRSEDGASIQAEEVVTGSFRNLAGTLTAVNPTDNTITLKDLATKRTITVSVTPNSDLRVLSPQAATMFVARERNPNATGAPGQPGTRTGPPQATTSATSPGSAATPHPGGGGLGRSAGADLSQMLTRLPTSTLADLHVGSAVMIVATQTEASSDKAVAVTLLSGVEPILATSQGGAPPMTLSPWNVGGGAPEGGGGQ